MAISVSQSDTHTTGAGTDTVVTISDPGVYVFEVNRSDITTGEYVNYFYNKKIYSAGTNLCSKIEYQLYYGDGGNERFISDPIVVPFTGTVTATSSNAGILLPWRLLRIAGISVEDSGSNDYVTGGGPTFDETADGVYVLMVDVSDRGGGDSITVTQRTRNTDTGTTYIVDVSEAAISGETFTGVAIPASGSYYAAVVGTALTGTVTIGWSLVRIS